MTPKEKAKELISKMDIKHYMKLHSRPKSKGLPISMYDDQIKQCALICVDEQLNLIKNWLNVVAHRNYLLEVKQELEKL